MNTAFIPTENAVTYVAVEQVLRETEAKADITKPMESKDCVSYEHEGYKVRVYFKGDKTLAQCMKNLAERIIEG